MPITASAVSLNVTDPAASAAFAERHLGFHEDMAADGFVSLSRADAGFNLIFLRTGLATFKPDSMRDRHADGLLVVFVVDDADAEYARLQQECVAITTPLQTEPWGERFFQVSDPNGVVVQFVQWVTTPTGGEHVGVDPEDRFPRASRYHPDWVLAGASGGANALWLAEWLAEAVELRPGMRVLDLGCGRAMSSVFLHREFGAQVWAVDLWHSAAENLRRIRDAGVEDSVFPIHADARSLPFAAGFFDAIVSIDAFVYFGTDDLYLIDLARFVRPGGTVAIAGAGLTGELDMQVPDHLRAWWEPGHWCLHSAGWWRRHWQRTGVVDVELADTLPEGWRLWLEWQRRASPNNAPEIAALEADAGRHLAYVRVVGRRTEQIVDEPIVSIPSRYESQPLLRGAGRP